MSARASGVVLAMLGAFTLGAVFGVVAQTRYVGRHWDRISRRVELARLERDFERMQ